jgi:hypothetical protein
LAWVPEKRESEKKAASHRDRTLVPEFGFPDLKAGDRPLRSVLAGRNI